MSEPVILCGLGHVGFRILELLAKLGERVTVVTQDTRSEWERAAQGMGARLIRGDVRDERLIDDAGLGTARALIAATDRDVTNLETALDAKKARPDLPIVVRLFDQSLASELTASFELRGAWAMSALAAPAFTAAALGESVVASFSWEGDTWLVGRHALEDAERRGFARLPGEAASPLLLGTEASWEALLEAPRRTPAPRWPAALSPAALRQFLAAVFRGTPLPLRVLFFGLVALLSLSTLVFAAGLHLSPVDAVYFLVTTVTTTGYGDINLLAAPWALKLYGCLVMLLSSAAFATLYSMITDVVVTARFDEILGRGRIPREGHVVVAGVGNLGFRVIETLRSAAVSVVAVDRDPNAPLFAAARALVPTIAGDARLVETLDRAGASAARAVVAVTGDDATNLAIGLAAKRRSAIPRSVVRLFDADFARKVERGLAVDAALSASRLAAPVFVAAALAPDVKAAFVADGALVALRELEVTTAWHGRPAAEVEEERGLVILLRKQPGGRSSPAALEPLQDGEKILAAWTRKFRPETQDPGGVS